MQDCVSETTSQEQLLELHAPRGEVEQRAEREQGAVARALAAARHADERFELCLENMLDCFGIFTAMRDGAREIVDFRIEYLNRAACKNNGRSFEEQVGHGLCELLPAHRTNGLFEAYCRVVETGEPLQLEAVEYTEGAGVRRWFDIRAFRLEDGFGCAWRDVTDREEGKRALVEREHRLQLALRAGRMGIWEWHVATNNVYWSPEAARQTVGTDTEHRCTLDDFRALVHPDDRDILWHKVQQALQGGEDYQHEFRIYSASGEIRWVSNAAIIIRDASGAPVRMVGTVSDITDRRLALHTLEKRTAELRAAEERLRQMASPLPRSV
jgi:PAS domain S-box-containing protein